MRTLLVEDDLMIGEVVTRSLKDCAYAVDWVQNGNDALEALDRQHYDVMLLDLVLPGQDGMQVLRKMRGGNHMLPVLIISARDAIEDRIAGLDLGADDYILKPFDMAELLARMRAVIRRRAGNARSVLSNGVISLDLGTHEATVRDAVVPLSNREFSLLQALMLRPGAILSRAELEDRLYGWGAEVASNAIEFLIHALRKKLGGEAIKNVRGIGWMVSREG
ncbi:response regulator transcription factor [Bordetella sp. FB-8]|uniref:response regulator transcription factor n=1 Tax=Bordetella sp. FB-8 TaxID=1159870 RepID=UPI0004766750|nr:response regulator transcription factor [Bordetella sp. FB-8]